MGQQYRALYMKTKRNTVKMGQQYRALYMKTKVRFYSRRQYEMFLQFLHFHGNTQRFYIVDSHVWVR